MIEVKNLFVKSCVLLGKFIELAAVEIILMISNADFNKLWPVWSFLYTKSDFYKKL